MSTVNQLAVASLFDAALETLDESLSQAEKNFFNRVQERDAFEYYSYPVELTSLRDYNLFTITVQLEGAPYLVEITPLGRLYRDYLSED